MGKVLLDMSMSLDGFEWIFGGGTDRSGTPGGRILAFRCRVSS
jgi:hypothetical protein